MPEQKRSQSAIYGGVGRTDGNLLQASDQGSYPAMMLDGLERGGMTIVAAMGIDTDGKKHILGLVEGGSENSEIVKTLLNDLIPRGLDPQQPRLYVFDGSKALAKAVWDTFGAKAAI